MFIKVKGYNYFDTMSTRIQGKITMINVEKLELKIVFETQTINNEEITGYKIAEMLHIGKVTLLQNGD